MTLENSVYHKQETVDNLLTITITTVHEELPMSTAVILQDKIMECIMETLTSLEGEERNYGLRDLSIEHDVRIDIKKND